MSSTSGAGGDENDPEESDINRRSAIQRQRQIVGPSPTKGPGHPNSKKPRKLGHAPRSLYEPGAECRSQSPPVVIDSSECSDNPPTVQQGLQFLTRF